MIDFLWAAIAACFNDVFWLGGALSIVTYVVPVLLQVFVLDAVGSDLKRRYNAEWAIVTGASSGIGRAIVEKLASQGINVVMAALDDDLLASAHRELSEQHPDLKFVKLGVNLGADGYMDAIASATKDIDVRLVFNNAGYIIVGKHHDVAPGRSFANFECNATAPMKITQHFAKAMVDKKLKRLIAFTSSSAGFVPNPLSSLYASTKSFLTLFAASVAAELRSAGVDVVVVHPSPIASNFFNDAGRLPAPPSHRHGCWDQHHHWLPPCPALDRLALHRAVRLLRLALLLLAGDMPWPEPRFDITRRRFVARHYPGLVAVLRRRMKEGLVEHELAWRLCESVGAGDTLRLHAVASQIEQRRRCRGAAATTIAPTPTVCTTPTTRANGCAPVPVSAAAGSQHHPNG